MGGYPHPHMAAQHMGMMQPGGHGGHMGGHGMPPGMMQGGGHMAAYGGHPAMGGMPMGGHMAPGHGMPGHGNQMQVRASLLVKQHSTVLFQVMSPQKIS